jgi:hypothetical protein
MNECPRLDMGLVVRSRILRFLMDSRAPHARGARSYHLVEVMARHVSLTVQRVGQSRKGARVADRTQASERPRRRRDAAHGSAVDSVEPSCNRNPSGQPRSAAFTGRGIVGSGVAAVCRQAPISPRIAEVGGKSGMKREAAPCQSSQWATLAPVERQKSARLAGCRAADLVTLDDDRSCAT